MRALGTMLVKLKWLVRSLRTRQYLGRHPLRMLALGTGSYRKEGWLTSDGYKLGADLYLNATKRLPFKDDTWDIIHSEHMLEHIRVDHVPFLLEEIFRVLKPNGLFRVTVPDLEIHAKNYVEKNDAFFKPTLDHYLGREARHRSQYWLLRENADPFSRLVQKIVFRLKRKKYWLVRSHGGVFMSVATHRFNRHHWMYDFETLSSCFQEVGFSKCIKQSFGRSVHPEAAAMDRLERAFETLYVDAVK